MSVQDWIPVAAPGPEDRFMGVDRKGPAQRFTQPVSMSWRQRLGRWLGNKLIQLGARLGGDDW